MTYFENALFPSDARVRDIAQQIYKATVGLPIISPHGHVDIRMLSENKPFVNPCELFIFFDHYVTRALHAMGVPLEKVRSGTDPLEAWRIFCSHWHIFAGTASGYWLKNELITLFGIDETPSVENADRLYQHLSRELSKQEFLPQNLFRKFNISFLATTDDPIDDVSEHKKLSATLKSRIAPTYRPDKYIQVSGPLFKENVNALIGSAGFGPVTYENFIEAFRVTRRRFIDAGAVSIDIGVESPYTSMLDEKAATSIFTEVLEGRSNSQDMRELSGHLLYKLIAMSAEDGLVVTLHAGVIRNHHHSTFEKFGADHGSDLPLQVEFVRNLQPVLQEYGTHPNLHLILFCVDETAIGRDIAPLAGFYSSVFVGVPWWFIDAPYALQRFRESTIESVGFYKGSGFIDDTRAFLSIPARHDMARRVDAGVLANLVDMERISIEEALSIAVDLVTTIPTRAFKL